MRSTVLLIVFLCVVSARAHAAPLDDAFNDGKTFGKTQNPATAGKVNGGNAATNVPNYNTTSPEAGYYGSGNLTTDGSARTAACAGQTGTAYADQACIATNFSQTNPTKRPVFVIQPTDSVVTTSKTIANDPAKVIGPLDGTFGGCKTVTTTTPPVYENHTCNEYRSVADTTCSKTLTVDVTFQNTCVPGTWITVQQQRPGAPADTMVAQVLCELGRTDGKLTFRFDAYGGQGECVGPQTVDLSTTPAGINGAVAALAPHWEGACRTNMRVVELAGSGCTGDNCAYQFLYAEPTYVCPAGQVSGGQFINNIGIGLGQSLPPDQCYTTTAPLPSFGGSPPCPTGTTGPYQTGVFPNVQAVCIAPAGTATPGPGLWNYLVPLAFDYPRVKTIVTDNWVNDCATFEARVGQETCQLLSSVCSDGPSTKVISGLPITRDCWKQDLAFRCTQTTAQSDCQPLIDQGCEQIGSKCIATFADGSCSLLEQTYRCKVKDGATSTITDCGTQSFCLTGNCFDAGYAPDKDFAVAVTTLEAGKEMGKQFDPATFQVFKGQDNRCDKKLFNGFNCCTVGDAINSFPLKQACNDDEKALAKKRDARMCHMVGSFCSQKILGACVKKTETYCCFLSLLSRIIHEQGRPQLPRGWGDPQNPDCAGLTVTQLQSLDFAKMDLSEFYAEIVPKAADTAAMQGAAGGKLSNCYFGKGQCQ